MSLWKLWVSFDIQHRIPSKRDKREEKLGNLKSFFCFFQSHGWTAYNRGQENDLHLFIAPFVFHPVVCLSYVNVTMSWDLDDALAVAFRPSMGPVSGSTRIEVSGFNFDSEGEYECVFGDVVEVVVPGQYMAPDKLLCVTPEWIGRDGHGRFSNTTGPVSVPFSVKISDTVVSNFSVSDFVFYQQPVVLSLSPASGDVEGGNNVSIIGTGFFQSPDLMCRFGVEPPRSAQLVSDTELLCNAPPWAWGQLPEVPVEVSENGVDYTRDGVQYTYTNAPVLGGWQLWQIILLIAGSAVGAGMIIAVLAICCYKRARQKDLSRRYMDSDTEGETEPLIASINSKSMRRVLSSVTRVSIEDLRIDRRIGRGSFGEVFHAFWNGTEIAVKKLPKHMLSNQKFLEDFAQEISIMAQLRHPNVIQFLGVAVDKASLYMLTEFMPRGSLYDVLHDREQNLPAELLVAMLLDTARGMSYLHTRLIHRDLKSHNLLVDQHWHVKICDFGLSRLFEPHLNTLTACGTPCWTAPEVLRNERYTEKADVYSYGIVIWECLTRTDPFAGMPPFHVVFAVGTQGARPEVPKDGNWPTELLDLMQSCWQESPDLRPSFAEIVPVLTGLLHGDDDVRGSGKGTPAKGKGAGGGNTAASTPSKQAADEAKTPVPTPSSNNNNSNNSNNKNNSNNDNSKSNNNSTAIN